MEIKEEIKLTEKSWLITLSKTKAEEMNKVWAKIRPGNELRLCKKMWLAEQKAGKFITKKVDRQLG